MNRLFLQVCIKKQREMHPDMDWRVADATDMTEVFPDSEFDVVVEKCTVDALVANERSQWEVSDATAETIHSALKVRKRIIVRLPKDSHQLSQKSDCQTIAFTGLL